MTFSSSMGYGHTIGGFGHGPYGHGRWLTFPFTPGYSFVTEDEFAVTPNRFESQDAQWYRVSRDRGRTLTYAMPFPSSSAVTDIQSFFLATGGPATRFVALDHESRTRQVVRFTTPDFTVNRQNGQQFDIPPFNLKSERRITYAEEIIVDSPTYWWRLNEPTGASSVFDNGLFTWIVGSILLPFATGINGLVIQGTSFGLIGLLSDDDATGVSCTSAKINLPTSYQLSGNMYLSVVIRPNWPPRQGRMQEIYAAYAAGGQTQFCLRINSDGNPQFVSSRSVVIQASLAALIDNLPHHLGVAVASTGYQLFVDGSLHVSGIGAVTSGTTVVSASIGYTATSLQYFDGVIQDVTVWCHSINAENRFLVYTNAMNGL